MYNISFELKKYKNYIILTEKWEVDGKVKFTVVTRHSSRKKAMEEFYKKMNLYECKKITCFIDKDYQKQITDL